MIIVGEHPAPLTLNLTAGQSETIALARVDVAGEPAGWAGAVTLETGLAGVDAITSAVAGDLATFVVPVDLVDQLYAARLTPGATRVRLLEDGRVVAAGMISWLADSGWTGATQQVQRYTVVVVAGGGGGGAGVTDHGALTGLMDDDHPQYLTAARGDARYVTPAGQAAAISAGDSATLSSAQTYALGLVDALTAASPSTLDTLAEIAAALGQDPTFAATITAALGKRVRVDAIQNFSVGEQAQARANIGATTVQHEHSAADVTSGQVAPARLGTGTADGTTYLRGDGAWASPAGGSAPAAYTLTPDVSHMLTPGGYGTGPIGGSEIRGIGVILPHAITLTSIMVRVATAGAGSSSWAIYTESGSTLTRIATLGDIDQTTAGLKTVTGSWSIPGGRIWILWAGASGDYAVSPGAVYSGAVPQGANQAGHGMFNGCVGLRWGSGLPLPATLDLTAQWPATNDASVPRVAITVGA